MGITGAHVLLYTPEADAVREILRDVFELDFVDSGGGWLSFGLPPAEVGVHPTMEDGAPRVHELSFLCDDIEATVAELEAKGIEFAGSPTDEGYGISATAILPGDLRVQMYEPRHASPVIDT